MPKVLTDEHVLHYRANGYLYPSDALISAEVDSLRSQLTERENKWGGALVVVNPKYRHNIYVMYPWEAPD